MEAANAALSCNDLDEESRSRTAVILAYYAVFHRALAVAEAYGKYSYPHRRDKAGRALPTHADLWDWWRTEGTKDGMPKKVRNGSIGPAGDGLHERRRKANYQLHFDVTSDDARMAVKLAEDVLQNHLNKVK